jgi:hypothetical protein
MRLCMFHPNDTPMERGWVGRLDGDRVLHLATQTLQSFFLGGGGAREHAEYALADVTLLTPVQYPPTVRIFDSQATFAFANATAVVGPGARIPAGDAPRVLFPRLACVIGADERIGGYTLVAEWRSQSGSPPKDRDFALGLGPVVSTPDELDPTASELVVRTDGTELPVSSLPPFDWTEATAFAAAGTTLRSGDVIAGPCAAAALTVPGTVELNLPGIGVLTQFLG